MVQRAPMRRQTNASKPAPISTAAQVEGSGTTLAPVSEKLSKVTEEESLYAFGWF